MFPSPAFHPRCEALPKRRPRQRLSGKAAGLYDMQDVLGLKSP